LDYLLNKVTCRQCGIIKNYYCLVFRRPLKIIGPAYKRINIYWVAFHLTKDGKLLGFLWKSADGTI